jgi:signal peptidase I
MEQNSGQDMPQIAKSPLSGFFEWVKIILFALVISLPIRYFIIEPFVVNGASMDPTFATGQFLIVDRISYRFENPSRGQVIVFRYPNNPSIYYIKRIIGLPGETISLKDGKVTVTAADSDATSTKTVVLDEKYIQSIHVSHDNLTVKLGPTQYFVMGDNRAESSDSRVWGPLEKDLIVGRPFLRLFPVSSVSIFPGQVNE